MKNPKTKNKYRAVHPFKILPTLTSHSFLIAGITALLFFIGGI